MSTLATITINTLAEQTNVDITTIIHYEHLNLIDKPHQTINKLKLYQTSNVTHITFIHQTKKLNFSTKTIHKLLKINKNKPQTCNNIHNITKHHLLNIRHQITNLTHLESVLAPLISTYPQTNNTTQYPIMNTLSHPI